MLILVSTIAGICGILVGFGIRELFVRKSLARQRAEYRLLYEWAVAKQKEFGEIQMRAMLLVDRARPKGCADDRDCVS